MPSDVTESLLGDWWEDEEDHDAYLYDPDDEDNFNYFSADNDIEKTDPDPVGHLYDWKKGLDPFNKSHDRVFVGNEEYQEDRRVLQRLLAAGVTHVLDCRDHWELEGSMRSPAWTSPQKILTFAANHTGDDGKRKGAKYFRFTMEWAEAVLARPNTKILAHCAMGINRGPSNGYAILRGPLGMNRVDALTAIRKTRPGAAISYFRDVDVAVAEMYGRTPDA